ncbi:hypothetical protein B595_0461 [Chlamydia psittaci 84/55]|nr:hypothetical protein B595_0461 [Chlamydia psittaci 84/55]
MIWVFFVSRSPQLKELCCRGGMEEVFMFMKSKRQHRIIKLKARDNTILNTAEG